MPRLLPTLLACAALVLSGCGAEDAPRATVPPSTTTEPAPTLRPSLPSLAPQVVLEGATLTPSTPTSTPRPSTSVPAPRATRTYNPLSGRPWGVYKGPQEMAWAPYVNATGHKKRLLAKIALAPKAKWFGDWISQRDIASRTRDYIRVSQAGNPKTLVQMSLFRMVPWEHDACKRLPTKAEAASYKRWIRTYANAIGNAHTAIVLQPDGPFSLCVPAPFSHPRHPARLLAFSSRLLSALPHTSVYIEIGSSDWPAPGQGGVPEVLKFLIPSGITHARGIALNGTHYAATENEIHRGAEVVEALAARGIRGKHVVINTSSNGRPFNFGTYRGPDADNAHVCKSMSDPRTCITLGIRPTHQVAKAAWGFDAKTRTLARTHVDGFLWFGRPWLHRQNQPFIMERALGLARVTPW